MEYVDLKRNFVPVGKDSEPDLTIGRAWGRKLGGWLEWADLLDHSRVVLLAEASSGKSEEFRHTATGLCAKGAFAFYTTIEQLAAGRMGLGLAEQELLERWKAGSERAWFFLDSVDEARLNQKKFDDALRNFSVLIGSTLGRASVLISCRASDWKGNSDRTTILEVLPLPREAPVAAPPEASDAALLDPIFDSTQRHAEKNARKDAKKERPDVLVVQLIPLSDDQRRLLAQACGITDVESFIKAVELKGLEVLAERPGDVLELAQYWVQKGTFGTLSLMTEHTVLTKLTEPDRYRPDSSELSLAKAREGAERLAAALTLGKSFTLLAPGQEPDPSLAAGAIDATVLLDNWTVSEVNALLRRGIFALATYGRIRFHHRSTQEYLTGKWLSRLLSQGCPRSAVFDIVFAECYGVETVVPSLRPAAAWLALDRPDLRDEVIRREPMLLLTLGDPAALPSDVKARLLRHLAARHVAGEISDDSIDRRAMWMFASPDLAEAISDAWKINGRPEFRADLVRLIREGKIKGCVNLAAAMAHDEKASDYHRIVGIQALVACDAATEIRAIVQSVLRDPSNASPRLASGFAEGLFPDFITVTQLLRLIEKSRPPREHAAEGFSHVLHDLWAKCPKDQRAELIDGLANLTSSKPFVHEYQRVARRHVDLARQLGNIAHDALLALGERGTPSASLVRLLSVVERAERPSQLTDDTPALNQLVRQNAKVQREMFWYDVNEVRQYSKFQITRDWEVNVGGQTLWSLALPDLFWLKEDLKSLTEEDDRRVALSAIAGIMADGLKASAASLRRLIGKNASLKKDLTGYLAPPKANATMLRHKRDAEKRQIKRARDEDKAKKSWQKFRDELSRDPSRLSNPTIIATNAGFNYLRNLSEWLHRKTGEDFQKAVIEWKMLELPFSVAVAAHFCQGMKSLWRITVPEAPIRAPAGMTTTKWTTILSFAALGIEAAEGAAFASALSEDEAERAALHACLSSQGYPDWLDPIVAAHPRAVVPIVREAFLREWLAEEDVGSYFSYHFAQSSVPIAPTLQQELFEIIVSQVPRSLRMLERGIDIVRNIVPSKAQTSDLRRFAITKFREHSTSNPEWALRYIALLFLADVPEGVRLLQSWLKSKRSKKHGNFVLRALGVLFGRNHHLVASALDTAPTESILKLTQFAYQIVRPENDVVHEGVFSPDDRDNAEGARNLFLKTLLDTPGPVAHQAMLQLAKHRDLRTHRIRFLELARRMAERDAEHLAWTGSEVLAFERSRVSPVKTGYDLFRLTQAILAEIVWDFGNADASSRAVLETAKDEDAVQEYLAEQFRLRAKDRYHTARESEVAEGNMPDIIISAVGAPFSVAVEGKHGGKGWSTNALEHALRKQLAEDYLRPPNRRQGILVISNHKRRGWLHPISRKSISFADMISYLQTCAVGIADNMVGPVSVAVVGIDALPRQRKRSIPKSKPSDKKAKQKLGRAIVNGRKRSAAKRNTIVKKAKSKPGRSASRRR